jgi:small-conductance mechanosensitive channel
LLPQKSLTSHNYSCNSYINWLILKDLFLTKYFSFPGALEIAYAIGALVLAYVLYRVLRFIFYKAVPKEGVWSKFGRELRYPVLLIFLEIAALLSLQAHTLPEGISGALEHALNICIIGTIGWLIAGIIRAFYRNFVEKYGSGEELDVARRTILTQVLFLYRLAIAIIFAVTIAVILLTFPYIKSVGLGILGSAGIAGIALGLAARPILLNFMVGLQIAATKMIKIGDAIFVEGEFARVESIHLTRVIVCTWDLRRIVFPISYFIDKPFQNWDLTHPELLGSVFLYCDYTAPVDAIRKKVEELLVGHPNWNRRIWNVQVTNCTEHTVEIRVVASANDAKASFDLRAYLREKLVEFLQKEYPHALPRVRNQQILEFFE